jgi:hypothetical protein
LNKLKNPEEAELMELIAEGKYWRQEENGKGVERMGRGRGRDRSCSQQR